MKKMNIGLLIPIIIVLFITIFGGTYAYFTWVSSNDQKTLVTFTATANYSCSADGGGNINSSNTKLAPTVCYDTDHVLKRTISVSGNTQSTSIGLNMWLDISSIDTALQNSNNFVYTIVPSGEDCTTGVVRSFKEDIIDNRVYLLNSKIYSASTTENYDLYIWLDQAEADTATASKSFNFTLGGMCTPDIYTVTFDANGGSTSINSKAVLSGGVYGALPTPTKEGYNFMGWSINKIPGEYKEIEYIQSTGTQYIYTGIPVQSGYEFETKASTNVAENYKTIIAAVDKFELYYYIPRAAVWKNISILSGPTSGIESDVPYVHRSRVTVDAQNLEIFSYNRSYNLNGKIYYVKMYDSNNNLLRNFVPAIRRSDNKPGLYETVGGVFYTNNGSGSDFIPGGEVQYGLIESIESTGAQYIYTDIYVESGYEFETKSSANTTGNYKTIIAVNSKFELYYNLPSVATWQNITILSGQTSNVKANVPYVHRSRVTTNAQNLEIFSYNRLYNLNGKIYYVKMYNSNNILLRNFVAAVRKSDNKPGLYETINGVFYTNGGTGDFSAYYITRGSNVDLLENHTLVAIWEANN